MLDNLFAWLTALALGEFLESFAGMVALTSLWKPEFCQRRSGHSSNLDIVAYSGRDYCLVSVLFRCYLFREYRELFPTIAYYGLLI
jgi:hypothetical protein